MLTIREKEYAQAGYNPNYPTIITTWKLGEDIPDWLSDKAKVKSINEKGEKILLTRETTTGGAEIISSDSTSTLITLRTESCIACMDREGLVDSTKSKIFVLTAEQLDLLYFSLS